jgi:hypothetical protein
MIMDLGPSGEEVVGYLYEQGKYCKPCFYKVTPLGKQVRFGTVRRAVQVQSQWKCCDGCGRDVLAVDKEIRESEKQRDVANQKRQARQVG